MISNSCSSTLARQRSATSSPCSTDVAPSACRHPRSPALPSAHRGFQHPEIMGDLRRRQTRRPRDLDHIMPEPRWELLRQDDILPVEGPPTLKMSTKPKEDQSINLFSLKLRGRNSAGPKEFPGILYSSATVPPTTDSVSLQGPNGFTQGEGSQRQGAQHKALAHHRPVGRRRMEIFPKT